jgi:hypothetical protein
MPPCWTRTQLSGSLHYPTCGSGGETEHLQPQRDNGHMSQTAGAAALDNMGWTMEAGQLNGQYLMSSVTPQALIRTVQDFLSQAAGAVALENGAVAFDLAQSKYSISGEYNRCLLHLWSAERNSVRRVLEAEVKNGTLRLAVQRLGQARPSELEICRERDRRSPTARRMARIVYEQKLRQSLDLLTIPSMLPAGGARRLIVRGGRRYGRLRAEPRAESSGRRPRGCERTDRS